MYLKKRFEILLGIFFNLSPFVIVIDYPSDGKCLKNTKH
jgi:hypothetical protein